MNKLEIKGQRQTVLRFFVNSDASLMHTTLRAAQKHSHTHQKTTHIFLTVSWITKAVISNHEKEEEDAQVVI